LSSTGRRNTTGNSEFYTITGFQQELGCKPSPKLTEIGAFQ